MHESALPKHLQRVYDLAITDKHYKEMAYDLGLSVESVKRYMIILCERKGIHGRIELMALRIRELSGFQRTNGVIP